LAAALAVRFTPCRDNPRRPAVAALVAAVAASLVVLARRADGAAAIEIGGRLGGGSAVHVDDVPATLLPFVAVCLLVVLVTAPTRSLGSRAVSLYLCGAAATFALFLTAHPLLIVALFVATAVPVWRAARGEPGGRPAARVYAYATGASVACLTVGTAMMLADPPWEAGCGWIGGTGGWLVAIAVIIREGLVPFHFWFPSLFGGAPMPMALLATVPQVGSYTALRLLVGHADGVPTELVTLAHLGPVTAVYGAAIALVQRDLRRLIGYLAFSQSALVLAGLSGTLPMELTGGFCVWIASGLSLTGIGIVAAALEGRAGPLRLDQPQGRFWDAPALAGFFLIFGLTGIGLPGSLSFVADDLIVAGSLAEHLHGGILVILATVFAAIAVVRGWFGIFGGPTTVDAPRHGILPRERLGMAALLTIILALGSFPGPLVRRLEHASASLIRDRRVVSPTLPPEHPGKSVHAPVR
jgi:NADH-quinone oxidoreductase subunit M